MALKLIIVSDFVCPYCYWLETLLDRLGEQLEIIHVPYQLTEPPAPRIDVWNDPVRRVRYAETLGPVCQAQGVDVSAAPGDSPAIHGPGFPGLVLCWGTGQRRVLL